MVREVDHHQRRKLIAEAVWAVLDRSGIGAASVRNVAAECGLSAGSLRHFFTTQDELHVFALVSLTERVQERVETAAREPDLERRVNAMLAEFLPLTKSTERELGIWFEFVQKSRFEPGLAAVIREQVTAMRKFFAHIVCGLQELGYLDASIDVSKRAIELHAVVDGIAFQRLTAPHLLSRSQAKAVLEAHVFGWVRS